MKKINMFIMDFAGYFVILAGAVLIAIVELLVQIKQTLEKFLFDCVVPLMLEFAAFANWILAIAWQGILNITSDVALHLSKWFLRVSKASHAKSEQLIEKTWNF